MANAIGIDIGNGYCFASLYDPATGKTTPLMTGDSLVRGMASSVFVKDDGEIITGNEAEQCALIDPGCAVYAVKRRMAEESITVTGKNGSFTVRPEEVYAKLVKETVLQAHKALSLMSEEPIYSIVLSYPSDYWKNSELVSKIKAAAESVEINGIHIKVEGMIPEPAAAALDFLHCQINRTKQRKELTAVVYDLGHGSFDSALVKVVSEPEEGQQPYDILAKTGLPNIGGYTFDELLIDHISDLLDQKGLKPELPGQLRNIAENIKHRLSESESATEHCFTSSGIEPVTVTRAEFEELIDPLLQDTFDVMGDMFDHAESEGITPDFIVITGGSGNIPVISGRLEELFSDRLKQPENAMPNIQLYKPSTAVADGDSRYAQGIEEKNSCAHRSDETVEDIAERLREVIKNESGGRENKVMSNRSSHDYGVLVPSDTNPYGEQLWLIRLGDKLPAVSEPFRVKAYSSRTDINIIRPSAGDAGEDADMPYNIVRLTFDGLEHGIIAEYCLAVSNELDITVICRYIKDGKQYESIKNSCRRRR